MVRVLFYASIISLLISAAFLFLPFSYIIAIFCTLVLAAAVVIVLRKKIKIHNLITLIVICLCFCAVGMTTILVKVNSLSALDGKTAIVTGNVIENPEPHGNYMVYTLETKKVVVDGYDGYVPDKFKIRISDSGDFAFSSFYEVKAVMTLKSNDDSIYKSSNYSENIYLSGNVEKLVYSKPLKQKPLYYYASSLSDGIKSTLYANLGYDEAALSAAVLLGDRTGLDDTFYNNTKASGVTHMLVVSGLHLSIIAQLLLLIFDKLRVPYRMTSVIMLLVVFLVMAVCGFTPSIMRAGLTYVIYFAGRLIFRRSDALNSLGASTVILLFINPFLFGSVGYLLSYASTFGVVCLCPKLYAVFKRLYFKGFLYKIYLALAFMLSQTLCAVFATLPLNIHYFGYISLIAPVTNILLSYAVTILLCACLAGVILAAVPVIRIFSLPFFIVVTYCSRYMYAVIDYFANIPYATVKAQTDYYYVWLLLAAAAIVIYLARRFKDYKRVKLALISISAISVFTAAAVSVNAFLRVDDSTHVVLTNAGDGIAAVIQYKNDTMVVGAGDDRLDYRRINTALNSMGEQNAGLILLPTSEKCYAGGADEALRRIKTDVVVAGSNGGYYGSYKDILSDIKKDTKVTVFDGNISGHFGEIEYRVSGGILYIKTPTSRMIFSNDEEFNISDVSLAVTFDYVPDDCKAQYVAVCGRGIESEIRESINNNTDNTGVRYIDSSTEFTFEGAGD